MGWIDWLNSSTSTEKSEIESFDIFQSVYSLVSEKNRAIKYYQKELKKWLKNLQDNLDFNDYIDYLYILWNSEKLEIEISFFKEELQKIQDKIFENKINDLISKYKDNKKFIEFVNYVLNESKEQKIDISSYKEKLEEIYQAEVDFLVKDYKKWEKDINDIIAILDFTKRVWLNIKNIEKNINLSITYKKVLELNCRKPIKPKLEDEVVSLNRHTSNKPSKEMEESYLRFRMIDYESNLKNYNENINFIKNLDKDTLFEIIKLKKQTILKSKDKDKLFELEIFIDKLFEAKIIWENILEDFTKFKIKINEKEEKLKRKEKEKKINNEIAKFEKLSKKEYEEEINKIAKSYWDSYELDDDNFHKMLCDLKNLWFTELEEKIKKIQIDINEQIISNFISKMGKKLDEWNIFDWSQDKEKLNDIMQNMSIIPENIRKIYFAKEDFLELKFKLLIIKEFLKNNPKFNFDFLPFWEDLESNYRDFIKVLEENKEKWVDISIFEKEISTVEKQVISKILKERFDIFKDEKNRNNAINLLNITLKAKLLEIKIPFNEEKIKSYIEKFDEEKSLNEEKSLKIEWEKRKKSSFGIISQEEIDRLFEPIDPELDLY